MKAKTRKILITLASALCAATLSAGFAGCANQNKSQAEKLPTSLINGGFESTDLSGWTIESGKAFDNDSVSSRTQFTFAGFENKPIPVNQTGNWYLDGKGYDRTRSNGYTGSIRSNSFVLTGDGEISMKLAGGALVAHKGEGAPQKSREKICYVGVYTAKDDKMVAKFTNKYFLEHTESYVNVNDYISGVCCTDNFYTYREDLSDYLGEEMYIRVVDNDTSVYYGYISVDDIRIGGEDAQSEGQYFVKTPDYITDVEAPSKYEIKNGDFETGSLAGWTVVEGEAFSHAGVNANEYWWNENITYSRDGDYHYGLYKPTATGVMRSSEFVLGGSGYISYKLGGCENNALTYLRFMVKGAGGEPDVEVAKYSNFKFWNYQFPYVENGMRLLNLVQYYADFSPYIGKTMYIEAVDQNTSSSDLGCMTLDSVQTYWENKPQWYTSVSFEAKVDSESLDMAPNNPEGHTYQIENGTFETGDLTGWTAVGDFGDVSADATWWNEGFPYNKKGTYLFTGISKEGGTGTLTSGEFELGGTGYISFRLGGGASPAKCYVSILDSQSGKELARFGNLSFRDNGIAGGAVGTTSFLANMVQYKVNLVDCGIALGSKLKLQIVDNATNDWGLVTADSFITYYENANGLPEKAVEAKNILPAETVFGSDSEYQILNGNFETGDMTGWTKVSGNVNMDNSVSAAADFWAEKISFNVGNTFFFNGWKAGAEAEVFAIKSQNFTLGGSGFISFKMGGRTARLNVYKADGTQIASYTNTKFNDVNFPKLDNGWRTATMTTFVADLSGYLGQELYIELCDEGTNNWGLAFFDEIITYYESAPEVATGYDTITLSSSTSSTGAKQYNIAWETAVNEVVS